MITDTRQAEVSAMVIHAMRFPTMLLKLRDELDALARIDQDAVDTVPVDQLRYQLRSATDTAWAIVQSVHVGDSVDGVAKRTALYEKNWAEITKAGLVDLHGSTPVKIGGDALDLTAAAKRGIAAHIQLERARDLVADVIHDACLGDDETEKQAMKDIIDPIDGAICGLWCDVLRQLDIARTDTP